MSGSLIARFRKDFEPRVTTLFVEESPNKFRLKIDFKISSIPDYFLFLSLSFITSLFLFSIAYIAGIILTGIYHVQEQKKKTLTLK